MERLLWRIQSHSNSKVTSIKYYRRACAQRIRLRCRRELDNDWHAEQAVWRTYDLAYVQKSDKQLLDVIELIEATVSSISWQADGGEHSCNPIGIVIDYQYDGASTFRDRKTARCDCTSQRVILLDLRKYRNRRPGEASNYIAVTEIFVPKTMVRRITFVFSEHQIVY